MGSINNWALMKTQTVKSIIYNAANLPQYAANLPQYTANLPQYAANLLSKLLTFLSTLLTFPSTLLTFLSTLLTFLHTLLTFLSTLLTFLSTLLTFLVVGCPPHRAGPDPALLLATCPSPPAEGWGQKWGPRTVSCISTYTTPARLPFTQGRWLAASWCIILSSLYSTCLQRGFIVGHDTCGHE
jgi:hypothetical protein